MSYVVLSDDESDHENGTDLGRSHYTIVKEPWRSNELIIWLRMMDLLACGEKWAGRDVAQQGNSRRLRVHSSHSKHGVAVAGLPKNCYNPDWLNTLSQFEREYLQVKPPYNMQFSEEEQRSLFCCPKCPSVHSNNYHYRIAAKFIPLANGEARVPENADISNLNGWLLHRYGKGS
jgi:hypothetical protein